MTMKCGFPKAYSVTGQTYSRHVDVDVVSSLAGLGASAHKVSNYFFKLQGHKYLNSFDYISVILDLH